MFRENRLQCYLILVIYGCFRVKICRFHNLWKCYEKHRTERAVLYTYLSYIYLSVNLCILDIMSECHYMYHIICNNYNYIYMALCCSYFWCQTFLLLSWCVQCLSQLQKRSLEDNTQNTYTFVLGCFLCAQLLHDFNIIHVSIY